MDLLHIHAKLPWMFPGAPLKVSRAPGNVQGSLTGLLLLRKIWQTNIESNVWQYELNPQASNLGTDSSRAITHWLLGDVESNLQ